MEITKYEHACLDIEEQGKRLLIDPGVFSTSLKDFSNVAGVVVTHVHPDHFDAEKLKAVLAQNPTAAIYTVQAVADALKGSVPMTVVTGGHKTSAGPFQLEFFGGKHAVIHSSYPPTDNVGLMVNSTLYYPGDSFSLPHQPVNILAVPANAPWQKTAEAMDFITAIKPKQAFPVHNAMLSEIGESIYYPLLENACRDVGAKYLVLKPGDSLSV